MGRQTFVRRPWAALAIAATILSGSAAGGQDAAAPKAQKKESRRVALDYKRDPRAPAQIEDASPRAAPDVPDDLKVEARVAASRAATPRRAIPGGPPADPEGLGASSGEKMAIEAVRDWGWRQYWRAGFQRGLREAINDPRAATWDRNEGFRYGRLDPAALVLGGELAKDAAQDAAGRAASDAVRAEFTDLSREPRRSAASMGRSGDASHRLPAGPWAMTPLFDDIFATIPFAATPGLDREARGALEGWNVQAAALARDATPSRAYDATWKDSAFAFSVWRDRQRPGSYWWRLGPAERDRFRAAFFESFDDAMSAVDLGPTYAGYRVGYADGWRYGIAVDTEWNYRQGYAAGFDEGVRAAASLSFPFLFDRAYAAAYDAEFRNWAGNAVPALDGLRLVDGEDDGVIEPGERIALAGELVNYGGASGTFVLRAAGAVLEAPAAATVRLPARSRTPLAPVELRIG